MPVLNAVLLSDDIHDLGLRATTNQSRQPEIAGRIEGRVHVFGSPNQPWQADAGARIIDAAIVYAGRAERFREAATGGCTCPPGLRCACGAVPTVRLIKRGAWKPKAAEIAASIREFGFVNPVLVDGGNGIIAGHGRVMAARKLGLATVPVMKGRDGLPRNGLDPYEGLGVVGVGAGVALPHADANAQIGFRIVDDFRGAVDREYRAGVMQ